MARGEPDSDAVQPPTAYGSGSCTPSQTACRYSSNPPVGGGLLIHWSLLKIPPLMICMCGLTTFRRKPLFGEYLFSHLPAVCCGTSILLMCLPLRLDAGSRPDHLHQRYAWREAVIEAHFWLKREVRSDTFDGSMCFILGHIWKNLHPFWRNEEICLEITEQVASEQVKCFWQFPVYILFQAVFRRHKF